MNRPHKTRKRFGQHFLNSSIVIDDIVDSIAPREDDTLVEIGPGQGAITQPLAESGATLHAVEFDRDLIGPLRRQFADYANVTVHEADALSFDFASLGDDLRIIGNLPYNISTPLLFHLVEFKRNIRDLHLMLQKEVVDRMAASPGTKDYGRLTIMLGCHMQVQPLFDVPPESFSPPPKVQSSVVAMRPLPADLLPAEDLQALSTLVAQAFSKRRKTMRNALKGIVEPEAIESAGINPTDRPEQVAIDQWLALAACKLRGDVTAESG